MMTVIFIKHTIIRAGEMKCQLPPPSELHTRLKRPWNDQSLKIRVIPPANYWSLTLLLTYLATLCQLDQRLPRLLEIALQLHSIYHGRGD